MPGNNIIIVFQQKHEKKLNEQRATDDFDTTKLHSPCIFFFGALYTKIITSYDEKKKNYEITYNLSGESVLEDKTHLTC